MSTPPPVLTTLGSKEDDAEYNRICEEYKHLMETIPKGRGWSVEHLYNYKGCWLHPTGISSNMILHNSFESRPTDIFLASFMKSGTTWMKALMFSTINRHRYTFSDHHLLHHSPQSSFPFIDIQTYPITDYSEFPEPRLFATHFPRNLLPRCITSRKFVYVCRDPKDVLVSKWLFMSKLRPNNLGPFYINEAFELFSQGISDHGPFWEHVLSYWRASLERPDMILFLKYEDLKKQPMVEVRKLAAFMGKPFTLEEEEKGVVERIVELCSFENLSNLEVNKNGIEIFSKGILEVEKKNFFRKGEIGDWKNYLSDEMKERIDEITNEKLKGSGLILGS